MAKDHTFTEKSGFTLIELSIVLVIIGLIVGGVLVGQDLIKAAEIRGTVGQYEKFNTATRTFRLKYNGLAGDIPNAAQFGWTQPNAAPGVVSGDGELQSSNGAVNSSYVLPGEETTHYWRQLSVSNLIAESILDSSPDLLACCAAIYTDEIRKYLPTTKVNNKNFWLVYGYSGVNYFAIFDLDRIFYTYGDGSIGPGDGLNTGLTPYEARSIDEKVDDGKPSTGSVFAVRKSFYYISTPASVGNCVTASATYTNLTTKDCALNLKFQ